MNEVYFLQQIAEKKRQLYSEHDQESAVEHFYEWAVERGHVPKDLAKALDRTNGIKLIAELKRPSPYSGDTITDFEPREIAVEYVGSGASAISVITEEDHFRGSLHCLRFVRQGIEAPILRNGFIIFPWEIWESKAYGADAVVITASILSEEEIEKLIETAREAGLQTLIDINSPGDMKKVLRFNPKIIGVNSRDSKTLEVNLSLHEDIVGLAPPGTLLVAASGIRNREYVEKLESLGYSAVVLGESLMRLNGHNMVKYFLGKDSE